MKIAGSVVGQAHPLFFIAGPCVIESKDLCLRVAEEIARLADKYKAVFVYKSSFDKANRTSHTSYRGPGLDEGLRILSDVKNCFHLPIITDVHEATQVKAVAEVADIIQTPALLSRQTDLIETAAKSGRLVNLKKGQFMPPAEMKFVVEKAQIAASSAGYAEDRFMLCERGTNFGYGDIVADMRSLRILRRLGCPVVFDASHAAQSGRNAHDECGGDRTLTPLLARAAVAAGVSGIFLETHPQPEHALCDAETQFPLLELERLIATLIEIDIVRGRIV